MSVLPHNCYAGGLNRGLVQSRVGISTLMLLENQEILQVQCKTSAMQSTNPVTEYWDNVREEIIGFLG